MNSNLRDRLRRLGVKQGGAGLKPKEPTTESQRNESTSLFAIESLIPGREVSNAHGNHFIGEVTYPLSHQHGSRALGDVLRGAPHIAARLSKSDSLANADLSRLAFLDIETTGLGGTGTLAFLIGVGVVEDEQFVLRQFFLRDPSEEASLLHGVSELLQNHIGLVTYNGRGFDVPIIQMRYTLARRPFDITSYPNLDLLPAARRLWRGRYENCSLGTLETAILGLQRTSADVPGALIPQMYVDYLRTRDAREMQRVIYHNAEDILSMVSLASHILDIFANPVGEQRSGMDCLRLAMWHDDRGEHQQADAAYKAALDRRDSVPEAQYPVLYDRYTAMLKKVGRKAEAVPLLEQWAEMAETDPTPCIELAKYYEWETKDIDQAKEWTARAVVCVTHWRKGWQRDEAWGELRHRMERLVKKAS
jgi:uncharacterized protein YprB with RNaseH-like and TPR domain